MNTVQTAGTKPAKRRDTIGELDAMRMNEEINRKDIQEIRGECATLARAVLAAKEQGDAKDVDKAMKALAEKRAWQREREGHYKTRAAEFLAALRDRVKFIQAEEISERMQGALDELRVAEKRCRDLIGTETP